MSEEKTNGKERTGIAIVVFEDWTGSRIERGVGVEGTADIPTGRKDEKGNDITEKKKFKQPYRFDVMLPVPSTDEDAKALYDCTLKDLIEAGVMKLSYDRDTDIGNMITEALVKGTDFGKLEDASDYAEAFENELSTTPERKPSQAKENKKKAGELDSLMAKYNVTNVADLMKMIEESKG